MYLEKYHELEIKDYPIDDKTKNGLYFLKILLRFHKIIILKELLLLRLAMVTVMHIVKVVIVD